MWIVQSCGWTGHGSLSGEVWVCLFMYVGESGMVTMDGWYSGDGS